MASSPFWLLLGLVALAQALPGGLSRALSRAYQRHPGPKVYWVPMHSRDKAHSYKALQHLEKSPRCGSQMSRVTRPVGAPVKRATSVQVFTRVSTFPRLRRLPAKFFVGTR